MDVRFLLDKPWLLFVTVCIALFTSAVLGHRLALSGASMETASITSTSPVCATDCSFC